MGNHDISGQAKFSRAALLLWIVEGASNGGLLTRSSLLGTVPLINTVYPPMNQEY